MKKIFASIIILSLFALRCTEEEPIPELGEETQYNAQDVEDINRTQPDKIEKED